MAYPITAWWFVLEAGRGVHFASNSYKDSKIHSFVTVLCAKWRMCRHFIPPYANVLRWSRQHISRGICICFLSIANKMTWKPNRVELFPVKRSAWNQPNFNWLQSSTFQTFLKNNYWFPMHCLLVFHLKCFFQPSTARLKNDKLNRHTYDNLRHLFEIDYAFSSLQAPVYS